MHNWLLKTYDGSQLYVEDIHIIQDVLIVGTTKEVQLMIQGHNGMPCTLTEHAALNVCIYILATTLLSSPLMTP